MQFGVFWWLSEPLSWLLNKLQSILGSYGLAIIALTILVKLLLWPLTAKATRSQKKMQALQGPMGKLKEKYKGNPQKLNQEMMKFYKENKVNPFAGCWPILIQIPIFLSMFWMLRSAAELYGQGFLWANDLSEQDSVSVLQGFSINLLPILMVATQWFQMKLNPIQMGPEMSEAQRINAKMMRFMPFMFLIFPLFLFLRPGAVLDDPKPHDDFADPDHQGDRKSKKTRRPFSMRGRDRGGNQSGMNCRTRKRPIETFNGITGKGTG